MPMLASFSQIRFGLLVGIGGGIARPNEGRDIRLGDVVVSEPSGTSGGVVQYDLGKFNTGRDPERIGCLRKPPEAMLKALAKLQSEHELAGSQIPQILEAMGQRHPTMIRSRPGKPNYQYQGAEHDHLFPPAYSHIGGADCSRCDLAQSIQRDQRCSSEPEIHYGVVASGNWLIKDVPLRDEITRFSGEDCLCIEMEAAGLMDSFPCLVIRGISDYADSHKNDRWQRYAAATAAAFAKELLACVPVHDLSQAPKAIDNQVIREHLDQSNWFIESNKFAVWKNQPHSFLWLSGLPGSGKTILSSTAIATLENDTTFSQWLLYFYFDFSNPKKQSHESMVRSLLHQLYYRSDFTRQELNLLFSSSQYGFWQPNIESLCQVLRDSIEHGDQIWIILDALDECTAKQGLQNDSLLPWIRDLIGAKLDHVHVLVTSRPEHDIERTFQDLASIDDIIRLNSNLVSNDIYTYIHARVRDHDGLERWRGRPDVQDEIEKELTKRAKGMFRWVACQIDVLESCTDLRMLKKAILSLPETLDETYVRIVDCIPASQKDNMIRILQFLLYSERPLRLEEAVDAIIVDPEDDEMFQPGNRMPRPEEILDKFGIPSEEDTSWKPTFQPLYYASLLGLRSAVKLLLLAGEDVNAEGGHFGNALQAASLRGWVDIVQLLLDKGADINAQGGHFGNALQAASLQGFVDITQLLLDKGDDVNAQGGKFGNALQAASLQGFVDITQLLLDKGDDVNAQGGKFGNALQAASFQGCVDITQLLLDKGADVNAQGGEFGNALHAASHEGHTEVVQLLLDKGAAINAQGSWCGNALQAASFRGHTEIVQLLLDNGANVNLGALREASVSGHSKIVQLLQDKAANTHLRHS
ncbi:MAG: hypothetical protein Q9165_000426 [Trypethelium subeluteriae]